MKKKLQPVHPDAIIKAARALDGVRWEHQGRTEQGIDCCGFIVEVAVKAVPSVDPQFEKDYLRDENGVRMLELLEQYLTPVPDRLPDEFDPEIHSDIARDSYTWRWADAVPGDVLALVDEQNKYPDIPRHLMFLTQKAPYWKGIHASKHGVKEHRLDIQFKRRIHSVWRVPGLVVK